MSRSRQSFWMIVGLGWLGFAPVATCAQVTEFPRPPGVRIDREWTRSGRPRWPGNGAAVPSGRWSIRSVLVPDLPTFLEAIAAWDERHYFPILIDDVELTFKFLRAFRPARIVRAPRRAAPLAPEKLWDQAVAAVGRSWAAASVPEADLPPGDAVPRRLGPTPPGVVLSAPDSPMLAGAVALAAGRFQPLIRWEIPIRFTDILSADEARALALNLETSIADRIPNYGQTRRRLRLRDAGR